MDDRPKDFASRPRPSDDWQKALDERPRQSDGHPKASDGHPRQADEHPKGLDDQQKVSVIRQKEVLSINEPGKIIHFTFSKGIIHNLMQDIQ